ncbi:type 2 isopentenyl-diphosphate Delta-isomerase [Agrilactobacillus yilanensis]|uniref:Isopentenyl-diphosphate delta-isomerase n=1 Tax=Agrilactobacillus yilanensis TaxID=2485997 RepID=A0ABW4J7M9_9LACO|nr:type 2 isopentenyl-diphosphate Delta-isomerase [Agrilactobacillus yilanensis]
MSNESSHAHRKDEHVALAQHFYQPEQTNDFDEIRLLHQSLPEMAVSDVHLETQLFGQTIAAPIYINAMTGGSERTKKINGQLAQIAAALRIPMAVGSESIALTEADSQASFSIVRQYNPDGLVFANMSADKTLDQLQTAIDLVQANALQIHLNPIQEAIMPEGQRQFYWLKNLKTYRENLDVPIIAKEVGFGMDQLTISKLVNAGIKYIDVSGKGGTNFAKIENARRPQHDLPYLDNMGLSTVESLLEANEFKKTHFFASGGVRQPLDIVKAWRLGAEMVGMSGTILNLLRQNPVEEVIRILQTWLDQLPLIMTLLGAKNLTELRESDLVLSPKLQSYIQQRELKISFI